MTSPPAREAAAAAALGALAGAGDTIAALSTAPGRSAVALVRVSGPAAWEVAGRLCRPWPPPERRATLCRVHDPATGDACDRAVVVAYRGPRSFTGDDVVELSTHGGHAAPALVLAALLAAGAREAAPGEFTRRALLAGKLDLVQAEAVADVIDAPTAAAHRQALAQLDGGLSRRLEALRESLLELEALLAYDMDFPEEDDGPVPRARVAAAADALLARLDALLATAPAGELVRGGAVVVIAGPPNAGKSSLFNALVGARRALVTDVPGTTRDALEAMVDGGRLALRLVDTAGLRESADVVERLGIEVSERWLARAHVVLACGDTDAALDDAVRRVRALTEAPVVAVRTKHDLGAAAGDVATAGAVAVSAESGAGLAALVAAVERVLADRHALPAPDVPLLTRRRHAAAVGLARAELAGFARLWADGRAPAAVAAVHLRAAAHALEELVGAVDADDVLGRVFARFCVGK